MEHISEILKRVQTNSANKNTDTWSSAEEEISPEPACTVCKGAKFVHPLLASGKPDYSQVIPCQCTQHKSDKERHAHLQRYSNLGSLINLNFDKLLPRGKSENPANQELFSRAYQAARAFADKPEGWLVLTGPSGCGKTHLAAAIANHCIENNHPVFYVTVPDLLDHLRATFSPASEIPYDEFFEQVRNTPLLILDDLGAQSSTSWAKEKLEQLLNHRYTNRLSTVIIPILPFDELEERIRTRLRDSNHYQVSGFDEKSPAMLTYNWAPQFGQEKSMTFDSFDWKRSNLPLEQSENLREAFRLAQEFARSPEGWLVFQGDNGCGKTHLAAAIVNYRYQSKKPALFIVVPDFLDHLRSTFIPESRISYDELFESVKNAPLLVLDDFGRQTTTPWAQEKLYQVINYRYNAQLTTVITTNCSTDEMDISIASRFIDPKISTLFHITAPNYWAGRESQSEEPRSRQRRRRDRE
ncbi:MAG: ATP-binding protein [Dehalococcoidales bacterium]|nr:ATP-binding protein [Dehalococcoidales bacterium]